MILHQQNLVYEVSSLIITSNVHAISSLVGMFNSDSHQYIKHPWNFEKKTYLFYGYSTYHETNKNIRNNLLNGKNVAFLELVFNDGLNNDICFLADFIQWKDFHKICDKGLPANFNKAPKLSYHTLHPGNSKQNVPIALVIIHITTIASARSYLPTQSDLSEFLILIYIWWTIFNSKEKYTPNVLGNAIFLVDKKTDFYRISADWIEL